MEDRGYKTKISAKSVVSMKAELRNIVDYNSPRALAKFAMKRSGIPRRKFSSVLRNRGCRSSRRRLGKNAIGMFCALLLSSAL